MAIPKPRAMQPRIGTLTEWYNPTKNVARLEIYVGSHKGNPSGCELYEIEPGGYAHIPSEYDNAIQKRKGNVIVAGLAPTLRKVGETPIPTIHPAIDAEAQERKAALEAEAVAASADARAAALAATAAAKMRREKEARTQAGRDAQAAAEEAYRNQPPPEPPPAPRSEPTGAEAQAMAEEAYRNQPSQQAEPRKRGRPKGSKNKPKPPQG